MLPNIFLNPYQQPENKLTYNFLCLLNHYSEQDFLDFLFDHRFPDSKIIDFESVFGGEESCPDGMIQLETNGKTADIYLEVKTFRRNVDLEQLKSHIEYKCNYENSYLLVIASKVSLEQENKDICKDKKIVKTWNSIASFLDKYRDNWVVDEFLSYGEMIGEFRSISISKDEIQAFHEHYVFMNKWDSSASSILKKAKELIKKETLDPRRYRVDVKKRWGRHVIVFSWDKLKDYDFGQWIACGIYYDESDHGIKFKEKDMPELVFFLDMNNKKVSNLSEDIKSKFKELHDKGFEDNSNGEITNNRWRVLFKRIPLSQINGPLNENTVAEFFKQCIDVFKNDTVLCKLL